MARVDAVDTKDMTDEEKRLLKSDQILRKVWLAGHCLTLVTSALVVLSYFTFLHRTLVSRVLYRCVFTFAVITYGVSVYKKTGHSHKRQSTLTLLQFQSFRYMALAFFWLFSKHHLLKLTPYLIYSALQAANYYATSINKDEQKSQEIQSKLEENGNKLEKIIAQNNVVLWLRLLLDVLLLVPGSGVSILVFSFYFRLTMENEPTQTVMDDLEDHVDSFMCKSFIPGAVRGKWKRLKTTIDDYNSFQLEPEKPAPSEDDTATASGTDKQQQPNGAKSEADDAKSKEDTTTLMNGN